MVKGILLKKARAVHVGNDVNQLIQEINFINYLLIKFHLLSY